jgi:hypothetical protein
LDFRSLWKYFNYINLTLFIIYPYYFHVSVLIINSKIQIWLHSL